MKARNTTEAEIEEGNFVAIASITTEFLNQLEAELRVVFAYWERLGPYDIAIEEI